MTRLLAIVTLLFVSAIAPGRVLAKALEDIRVSADTADVMVTVFSDVPLRTPTIRTYAGLVRVRFYDVVQPQGLRIPGDGGALRAVELGRGSDQTAALTLVLGDQTKLAPADVRVEMAGQTTTLRLARGLLPAVRDDVLAAQPARPVAVPEKPAAAPVAREAAPPAVAPTQPTPVRAPTAATVPAVQPAPAPAAPAAPALFKPKPEQKREPEKLTGATSSSTVPILIGVTVLLALAYGGLQLLLRKRTPSLDVPSIDVIAQKSLGPRHQLVIVRAFDRDYLLSVQGGQTTVVARSTRRRLSDAEALLTPAKSGMPSKNVSVPDFEDDEVTFGGELFKQALEQRERAREKSASYRLDPAQKDLKEPREPLPRSELDKLQVDGGGYNEDGRILGNDGRVGRGKSAEPERRAMTLEERLASAEARDPFGDGDDVAPRTPDGMSESVSGLLRLRKQAGR